MRAVMGAEYTWMQQSAQESHSSTETLTHGTSPGSRATVSARSTDLHRFTMVAGDRVRPAAPGVTERCNRAAHVKLRVAGVQRTDAAAIVG